MKIPEIDVLIAMTLWLKDRGAILSERIKRSARLDGLADWQKENPA